MKHHNIN